jgi:hypothetical protein
MGGGSLMQLVAVGSQDVPLVGNPQMTYFKSVFKRHTHFALESIPLNFNQVADFGKKSTCLIDKKADLLTDIMLEIKLPALPSNISWINAIGYNLINKVELEIGGSIVDTIYGRFLDVYSELSLSDSHYNGNKKMIGKHDVFTKYTQDNRELTLYIRLPFWFTNNYGLALPLIALQYHDVVLSVHFNKFSKLWYSGTDMNLVPDRQYISNATVYCDYIFLETNERRMFAKKSHTYLIKQHQARLENPVLKENTISRADLDFNLPVKEIYWVYQANSVSDTNDWSNYSNTLDNDQLPTKQKEPITEIGFTVNGHDRFSPRDSAYFRLVQPIKHHTRVSSDYIYSYSFALYPEKSQPSGTLNFSWVNSATMIFTHPNDIKQGNISIFAVNYNYLQIVKGMASLVYQS